MKKRLAEHIDDKIEDIFSVRDTSDLPKYIENQIKSFRASDNTKKLLLLFDIKNSLSIDEILIGMYRKFKLQKTRRWVASTLYNLGRKKIVIMSKSEKWKYERIKND